MLNFLLVFFLSLNAGASWEVPNPPLASLGDPGCLYLNNSGVTFHFNNNDFIGNTDKLMTGSTSLFLYYTPAPTANLKNGYELSINRRLLTPIEKTRFSEPRLPEPYPGVHGDETEIRAAYSAIYGRIKFEASLSSDDYGNYYGDEIQSAFHRVIGSQTDEDEYGPLIYNNYISGTLGLGAFVVQDLALVMLYYRNSPVMEDLTARLSLAHKFGGIDVGVQIQDSFQLHSDLYGDSNITGNRYEWAASVKWHWFQSTFSYIENYLIYDKFGQYYIDPVVLSYEF